MMCARILNRILDFLHTAEALNCELGSTGEDNE